MINVPLKVISKHVKMLSSGRVYEHTAQEITCILVEVDKYVTAHPQLKVHV